MNPNMIGVAIAQQMARRGLTDHAAADLLGVSQPTISRWRSGKVGPQVRHAIRLTAFLDLPLPEVEWMIDQASPQPPPTPIPGGPETFGVMMRRLEMARGIDSVTMMHATGIDKSRFYRLRADKATPMLADIPDLARRLRVTEVRCVLAAFRTELARVGRARQAGVPVGELARH